MDAPSSTQTAIVQSALNIAGGGSTDISTVLRDIEGDSVLGSDSTASVGVSGKAVLTSYGYASDDTANIQTASGAMVIDDLMQRISTKVQVAAQMLSTINNINKNASRVISQG